MEKTMMKIEGMTCGHCKQSVEKALTGIAGVERAEVNLAKGQVKISYHSSKVGIHQMQEAVEEQGYDVKTDLK